MNNKIANMSSAVKEFKKLMDDGKYWEDAIIDAANKFKVDDYKLEKEFKKVYGKEPSDYVTASKKYSKKNS